MVGVCITKDTCASCGRVWRTELGAGVLVGLKRCGKAEVGERGREG